MFIDSNDLVEINVYYKKNNNAYSVIKQEEWKKLSEENRMKYKCLTIKAKPLTWGMYNDLNEDATIIDNNNNRIWSNKLYKEGKLRKIIVSWNAEKTIEGKTCPVPVSPDTIKTLSRDIAEEILTTYDKMMIISEEEEGK